MSELSIELPVVRRAERAGFFVRKVKWEGRRNAPDRVFSRKDRGTVFIEFKDRGKAPNIGQLREHDRMREAGMEVHVCDSIDEAMQILGLRGHNGGPPLDDGLRLV